MSTPASYRLKFASTDILMDSINAMEFSPDGRLLSAADTRGCLVTFDLKLGTAVHVGFMGPRAQIFCLAWSTRHELFFGCTNGVVASIKLTKAGDEVGFAVRDRCALD